MIDQPETHDTDISPEIAEHWDTWSRAIGTAALPRLRRLRENNPEITSAILCTADGMNLCAVGIPEENVGRLAALNSSLFAIAASEAEIVSEAGASPSSTTVHLSTGNGFIVLASFVLEDLGQMLLALSAEETQLGMLAVQARGAADDIRQWLSPSE
ncbi:hypothetical protein [Falsarthrobacter nasiphocae]|uniref:Regulator of Ras-like GTPase activity (Roadblock/LC7/MglB family) n=1 Tax=Falsarthrobacter nasiphocae TaxID=189863 RepID=A0AAE3YHR6_9MICC|nr:hypothetical protein [Falsarthrobacter nasiphocae]MDR6892384.1 putative regulator of Ras-like GTPase activity (Roadblock/LC7/MglB family) [Falsarthrobacter nasiphocae]